MNTFDTFADRATRGATRLPDVILVSERPEFPDIDAVPIGRGLGLATPAVPEGIVYSLVETVIVDRPDDHRRVLRVTPAFEEFADRQFARPLDDVVPMEFHLRLHGTHRGQADFAPEQDIIVGPRVRHCGIGSYAMNALIVWGQSIAPAQAVKDLRVTSVDARTDLAATSRSGFYARFGFEFVQDPRTADDPGRDGHFHIDTLGDLVPAAPTRTEAQPLAEFVEWLRGEIGHHPRPGDPRRRALVALAARAGSLPG